MNCPSCGSGNIVKRGFIPNGKQRYKCKECNTWSSGTGAPKILLFDIETSHIEARIWDTGDQYVRPDQITKPEFIICWSAKWLFEGKAFSDAVTSEEAKNRDDTRIVMSIHKLLSQADIVITQNGDKFDIRKLQWKFLLYKLPPNNKYHSIDTLKKSRQIVDPISHGLGSVALDLGFGEKSPMVEQDWFDSESGNPKAIKKMMDYCTNDVYVLEDWYLVLRPWMKTHPNLAKYIDMYQELAPDERTCPRCMKVLHESVFSGKWRSMASGKLYSSGFCSHCGTHIRIKYLG